MSDSNGYNSNSLFALEQSLLGNNPAHPAEQFSAEEMEEYEEDRSRGVEAQAFDWDDAIALEYEEDIDPNSESMSQQNSAELEDEEDTARSMSWQNYGYASRGFEVEEEETEDPLSRSNSLYSLEQSVFGFTQSYQPSVQFAVEEEEEDPSQPTESQAFDWDEAIALEYPETLYPTPMSLDWQPSDYPSESFSVEDEPPTYNVEAFEVEEESEAAPTNENYPGSAAYGLDAEDDVPAPKQEELDNSQAYGVDTEDDVPASKQEELDNSQAYGFDTDDTPEPTSQKSRDSEAISVNATVATPPSPPLKSAQPVEALSDDDFDELERAIPTNRASDAEAFAADLAAILRGEKVYEPPAETPAPPPPAPQPQLPAPQSQAQSVSPKKSSPHDIFDQMGRNMAHATAFDLGTFSLEQRFDEFDAILDAQESESLSQLEDVQSSAPEDTFETAGSFAFDDDELEADVAALSAGDLWQATQFGLDDDAIDNLVKSNQPSKKDIQEKFSNYFKRLKLSAKKLPGYDAKTDDVKIQAAVKKIWGAADSAPAKSGKIAIETPKITGEDLKKRYWHHISIGGTESNPKDLSGYHWSGYEDDRAMFKRIGQPTKQDVFGIYKQYVQQKGTTNIKKDASSFFPDTWTEQHFDDLFNHFAQRRDFKSNKGGTYEILAAIGGDDKYKSMRVTFMPNAQGGSCVPVYVHEKDRDVQTQLTLKIDPDPEVAQMQSQAQMLGEEFSSSPYGEMYAELDANETDLMADTAPIDSPEMAMQQLLSDSFMYSGAFVGAAPSTLPNEQTLTARYTNHQGLLTPAEVTEIQRLSAGGAAAGPAGTKALSDRDLMDHQAMVAYATGNNFSNWESLPKPTRLQVATYQWGAHNPAGGVDMSNKPGYWKARSLDAHSNPASPTAAQSKQAIYDRDRDIWTRTLSVPDLAAVGRIQRNATEQVKIDAGVREILQRVFALLHLNLQYRNGANPYQPWTLPAPAILPIAVALSHGGRVNVKLPANSGDAILDWLFVSAAIKDKARVGTRSSSTHNIKITPGGQFQEKKELFKLVGMTHYGMNLAVGGIGNLDVNGNPILPNGAYGHLYIGYRKPEANTMGGLLIGVENDEYGATNPLGHKHDLSATEAEMSPTGGLKVDKMGSPAGPGDTGFMLVDLTTVANLRVQLANVTTKLDAANQGGHVTINAMAQRLTGVIDPTLFI